MMIQITGRIAIDEGELDFEFVRAAGPGGQNVNKVATAAQLRFDITTNDSLPNDVKHRLIKLAGRRVTAAGMLIIQARRYRTQGKNRQDALDRFITLVRSAATPPKARRKTKPSLASKRRRLDTKRRTSLSKERRRPVDRDHD